MAKKNILQESLADAKQIKEAAIENASSILMEQFKDKIDSFVGAKLNEMGLDDECETEDEVSENQDMTVQETDESVVEELDDLEVEDEEGGDDLSAVLAGDEEDEEVEEGITLEDLDEVVAAALQEVDHADLGDMELVDPEKRADGRGPMPDDTGKEAGWEEKEPPAKHNYYGPVKENSVLRKKVAVLAKENMLYKKANAKLKEALEETKLFNTKVLYATKLLRTEGLNRKVQKQIVENLDGVKTLAEAKSVYNTWKVALGAISESVKTSQPKSKTSLSEALGSNRGTGKGVSSVDASHMLNEGDDFSVERMQKLAGIL